MTTVSIHIDGLEELKRQLDPKVFDYKMGVAMKGALDIVKHELKAAYPESGPSETDKARHWAGMSEKAKRGFFAALKEGKIQVPYVRGSSPGSEKLGASWRRKLNVRGRNKEGTVGTRVSYARYVMDEDKQAIIHQGRWPTVQQIAKDTEDEVRQFFAAVVKRMWR